LNLNFDWNDFPTITADLPGTGGRIRAELEDFEVSEESAYPLSGEGEHLYLQLEKRGNTTKFVVDNLARQLGVKFAEVGVAGLKDRHALTRQWISLPAKYEPRLEGFSLPNTRILQTTRHTNKLGIGHLKGNHFRIRVRDAAPDSLERASSSLERLRVVGVPNYFGPQRFGNTGSNAARGLELVLDGRMKGPESIAVKRFLISSLQSLLFNHIVARRVGRGVFDGLLLGDVAKKHDTGGVFTVEDVASELERARSFEISATAPLFGRKVMPAHHDARVLEDEVLSAFGLNTEQFKDRHGDRRITRIKLGDLSLEPTEDGYWFNFFLPKGSFATVVLREIMKVNVDAVEEGE
jgi:tRNA pseudouridine13 synthase